MFAQPGIERFLVFSRASQELYDKGCSAMGQGGMVTGEYDLCVDVDGVPEMVNKQTAIENGPVEIVYLPIKNGGSFHSFLYVYQRVSPNFCVPNGCFGEGLELEIRAKYLAL